ncbi:MAG TPA: alpha/beta fold hydrolase [Candidatus Omnitrophota bacterium]|nr:alpha/beta fold hydrolase [Candidatus Omnitrophota bacterium]
MSYDGGGTEAGLVYRSWQTASPAASLVLVHGLGAHSGRWDEFAGYMQKKDISSYAIDLKGFGHTKTFKGHIDTFRTYLKDIKELCNISKKSQPDKKVFCAGESMGGLLAYLLALEDPSFCDGVILMSPAFKTKFKVTVQDYINVFGALLYNPKKVFDLPIIPEYCTRERKYQDMIKEDERECHGASSSLLTRIVFAQFGSFLTRKEFRLPILFLLAGEDRIVDTSASINLFKGLKAIDKKLVVYDGMYHAISIDKGRENVFHDTADWIYQHL